MEYKPKLRRGRVCPPFGWFVCPTDHGILIPDPKKIEAIHYAFRMRAKYKTSIRDCTQWLHAATGQRMTAGGFLSSYNRWKKSLYKDKRREVMKACHEKVKDRIKYIEENYKAFGIVVNDRDDITALADAEANEKLKNKERKTTG